MSASMPSWLNKISQRCHAVRQRHRMLLFKQLKMQLYPAIKNSTTTQADMASTKGHKTQRFAVGRWCHVLCIVCIHSTSFSGLLQVYTRVHLHSVFGLPPCLAAPWMKA